LRSNRIAKELKAEAQRIKSEIKLLLLGTGESGKSTFAKQMKIMHLDGFTPQEKDSYRAITHNNIVEAVTTLVIQAEEFDYPLQPHLQEFAERLKALPESETLVNEESAHNIAALWKDPAIRQAFDRRAEYQLPGSIDYLLDNTERLLVSNAELTVDDILRCRMRTTGIIEIEFVVENARFRLVDVGGQRSERRKWFHCFSQVTAVLFCVALNEYDEKLYEDEKVNRMVEALNLFEEVSNSKFFNDPQKPTHIVLFLNKSDLFREKIKRVPLTTLFPNYKGGEDFDEGTKYIKKKFVQKCKDAKKLIFSHVTCATDTENIRIVFNAVRSSILHNNLTDVGYV